MDGHLICIPASQETLSLKVKMPLFKGKDGSGKELLFVEEEGNIYPQGIVEFCMQNDLKKKLYDVRDFETREDDVFICAFAKSGTHWLWEIVSMLINKTSEYDKKAKEVTMMEFRTKEELDEISSPRILNHHFPLQFVPQEAIRKKRPILHIMRNPKDVCVSYFVHWQTLDDYESVDNFSAFLPLFTGENGFYLNYSWCQYVLEWEKFTRENPDYPILNLYYEDLKQDPISGVRKVAEFLKVEVTNDLIETIADKCQIENMRKATIEVKKDILSKFLVDGKPLMYRKGEVGDWKNWFTVAESEKFDKWLNNNLVNTNLKFTYSL